MFERFTDRARNTVVLAQNEARRLQHNYVGTEHILLGLLGEPDGVAGRALDSIGLTLDKAREQVRARVDAGMQSPAGHIPFTPRSKKILELALREALTLGHNYIGTEHILLGLIRVNDGIGAEIVAANVKDGDLGLVRKAVIDLIPAVVASPRRKWIRGRSPRQQEEPAAHTDIDMTPAAETTLNEAAKLAGSGPVGSQHLLLAALADPDSAASRSLGSLGIDLDQVRETLRTADTIGSSDEAPEEAGRRQLRVLVAEDRLTIETADRTLVQLAREALGVLGEEHREAGSIPTDLPVSIGFAAVWQSLRDALDDVRRRAIAQAEPPSSAA